MTESLVSRSFIKATIIALGLKEGPEVFFLENHLAALGIYWPEEDEQIPVSRVKSAILDSWLPDPFKEFIRDTAVPAIEELKLSGGNPTKVLLNARRGLNLVNGLPEDFGTGAALRELNKLHEKKPNRNDIDWDTVANGYR